AALGPGAGVVERPTYDRPRKILFAETREVTEIAIDDDGLDVDALEAEGSTALLYTIPTFQNPSGVTLSEERRRRLAALVRKRELPVLEDDPYGLVRVETRCSRRWSRTSPAVRAGVGPRVGTSSGSSCPRTWTPPSS